MVYDPQLDLIGATENGLRDARPGQYLVEWLIPSLPPGSSEILEAEFNVLRANPRSTIVLTSRAAEGATSDKSFEFEIVPGAPPTPLSPSDRNAAPSLPPALPAPTIPRGPAPIPATPDFGGTAPVAPGQPTGPVRSDRVQYRLDVLDNPVRVGEPIRYSLRVVNDSDQPDGSVSIRFALPDGVSLSRAVQRQNPIAGEPRITAGLVYLPDIRSMRPGEVVDYDLVLVSNQPQTFPLDIEVVSQRNPNPNIDPNPEMVTVIQ